jgi:squalene-associated FAD-dependent desaturase
VDKAPAIVIGGGLAGISASLRLADAGRKVVLLERRRRLGGLAFSFQRGPLMIDNGQHVYLRCCEAYRALLTRLEVQDLVTLQDHLDIPVLRPDGRRARLMRVPGVPAPVHLGAALATYRLLSPADRVRAVRGALALRRLDPTDRSLDTHTLGEFLRAHGQNDATIGALWGVVATATLNLDPDEASLALAAKVFRTGLLDHASAADLGYSRVPLGQLHSAAALHALHAAGVEVLLGHRVEAIVPGATVTARGEGGARTWRTDVAILATAHREAFAALPELTGTAAAPAAGLGATPIVNVHVIYERRVTDLPFAAVVGSPVQWFFDRTDASGLARTQPGSQYLAVTVSAADAIAQQPSDALADQFVGELARLLPASRRTRPVEAFVTREHRATFRQAAGSVARRPSCHSGLPGIWLAGAWTDTGWPDTMEGAVRSGTAAADAALAAPAPSMVRAGR